MLLVLKVAGIGKVLDELARVAETAGSLLPHKTLKQPRKSRLQAGASIYLFTTFWGMPTANAEGWIESEVASERSR